MAIAYTETSQAPMVDSRFKTAAFMSLFFPILRMFAVTTAIFLSMKQSAALHFLINTPLTIVIFVFDIYILLQLKRLLVERHHLHNMRILINLIITSLIYGHVVAFFMRISQISAQNPDGGGLLIWIPILIPGVLLLGIFSIIFSLRLLEARDLTLGLYRTFAKLYIVGYVCLFTIILFPIAGLSFMASDVVLGIIFLKESETEAHVEFV